MRITMDAGAIGMLRGIDDRSVQLCQGGLMWTVADLDQADGSRTDQVAALIVRRIERGDLAIGSRLPSERDLAEALGVSRVTVVRALGLLRDEGTLSTRHGSGSSVQPLDRLVDPVAPASTVQTGDRPVVDLRYATTAAPQDVAAAYGRLMGTALAGAMAGDGPPVGGSTGLRTALASWLSTSGVETDAAHLTVTVGAASALEATVAALDLGPGTALTETPTYPAALDIFRRHRLDVVGWPAGSTGWDIDQLTHLCRRLRPAIVYLQADNHNPTGLSLPAERRVAAVAEIQRSGAIVISDETLRPLWLADARQPPAISALPRVIGIGSLSKTVWGGLRVGWIRSSRLLRRRLVAGAPPGLISPGALDELLAIELADRLDEIADRRRSLLRHNLTGLEAALSTLPDVAWSTPTGGMTLWLELLAHRPRQVVTAARRAGLLLSHGELFTPDQASRRHLRLPFTASTETLTLAVDRLREAMTG